MKTLVTVLSLFMASASLAEDGNSRSLTEAPADSFEAHWNTLLNTVVVTGTRTPKLLKNSPVLTRLITSEDIRRTDATNIQDLLQAELPGIEFTYSMNQQTNLNMQGFGGNSVLFLVDGERLAGETLDNIDYNRLNMNNVGRIEIVKGGASALYGSNAVGGVVNILSRETTEPWTLNVNTRYGAHNEQRYGATFNVNSGIISSSTTASFNSINSYDMKHSGDYNRFYGGFNYNLREKLTVRASERLKLVARAGYYFRQRNAQENTRDRYRGFSGGLRGIWDITAADNLEISYNFDQFDKSDYLRLTRKDVRKYSNVQNSGRALFSHTFGGNQILTVGGDVMRDYLQTYQFTDGGNKHQVTADFLAQFDFNFLDRFNAVIGARYDYFSEADMKHFSSRASLMYKIDRCNLRASYAGGFRAPTLKEMYMDFDMAGIFMIYGNPDLKPETSHNFQISTEYTRGGVNFNMGGFCNLVDDRITTAWSKALNGQLYTNISRVTIAGADASVAWRHRSGFGAKLSYMYTVEHLRKGEPATSSTRPHTATARFDYSRRWKNYGLGISLNGRYLSPVHVDEFTSLTDYQDTEKVRYPGYTMWRLNITSSFWRGIDLNIGIDNLFNYVPKYYYSNSPSTNGITLTAGVSLDIDRFFQK